MKDRLAFLFCQLNVFELEEYGDLQVPQLTVGLERTRATRTFSQLKNETGNSASFTVAEVGLEFGHRP